MATSAASKVLSSALPAAIQTRRGLPRELFSPSLFGFIVYATLLVILAAASVWLIPPDLCSPPVGWKFEQFLADPAPTGVLLLGSSLGVVPAVRVDAQLQGRRARVDIWQTMQDLNYPHARYLSAQIARGRYAAGVSNMTLVAAMASDDRALLERLVRASIKPSLVVCLLAPRDFVSNIDGARQGEQTYVAGQIQYIEKTFPEFAYFKQLHMGMLGCSIADWHFRLLTGWRALRSVVFVKPVHLLRDLLIASGLKDDNPLVSLLTPADGGEQYYYQFQRFYGPKPNTLEDIDQYKKRYQPANWPGFVYQVRCFEDLLQYARENSVSLLVVDMPVTSDNLSLLDRNLLFQYRAQVPELCTKYGVPYLSFAGDGFSRADFEDSVHLNAVGGRKFFDKLAESIQALRK